MKRGILLLLLAILVFAQGCCSIFTSGPQTVSVNSKPQGADVKIGLYKGKTPYQVSLPRGKDHVIVADYSGKSQTQTLEKSIEPVYWVNILFWPGLIIDLATGKMFKYEPLDYEFDFTTQQKQASEPQPVASEAVLKKEAPVTVTKDIKKQQTDSKNTRSQQEQISATPASSNTNVIKCGNCGHEIAQKGGAFVYNGKIICSDCYAKLKAQQ